MNPQLTSNLSDALVKIQWDNIDEETGYGEKCTDFSNAPFITENSEYKFVEFCMIVAISEEQEQKFFCLIVEPAAIGNLVNGEVGVIITLTDGTKVECTHFGEVTIDETPFGTFSPINVKNPNLDVKIDGLNISVNSPEEVIESNWRTLATTSVARIRVQGSTNHKDYIPNPNFKDFPAQNLFIEHLKAIK